MCLAVLAGCGGGDDGAETQKERYTREFKAAIEHVQRDGERLPDLPDDAPLPAQGQQLRDGIALIREAADRLGAIDPPAEVARAHERFIEGLRRLAADARALVRAAEANDASRLERLLSAGPGQNFASRRAVQLVFLARQEFERKGYDVVEPLPGLPAQR